MKIIAYAGLLAAVCVFSPMAEAASFTIKCAQFNCGTISVAPRASLLNVDPNPLPRVDPGDSQTVTVEWSTRIGLKSSYALCLTASPSSGPAAGDHCETLPGANLINQGLSGLTYEDTVTIPAAARQPAAEFYVKTTARFTFTGKNPETSISNRMPFVWPLSLANLYTHNPKPRLLGGSLLIEQKLSNRGATDASPSITEYMVSFCDGNANPPLVDPEDVDSDRVCNGSVDGHLHTDLTTQAFGWIAAGASQTQKTDITGMIPPGMHHNGLWVTIIASADADGDVDESNEQDNVRLETRYITP